MSPEDGIVDTLLTEANDLEFYWNWPAEEAKSKADKLLRDKNAGSYLVRQKSQPRWLREESKITVLVLSVKGERSVWHFDIYVTWATEGRYKYRLTPERHAESLAGLIEEHFQMGLEGTNMQERVVIKTPMTSYQQSSEDSYGSDVEEPGPSGDYVPYPIPKCVCGLFKKETLLPLGYSLHLSKLAESLDMPYFRDSDGKTMWRLPPDVYAHCSQDQISRIRGMARRPSIMSR